MNAEVEHPWAGPWRHKPHGRKSIEHNFIPCLKEEDIRLSTWRRNPRPPSYVDGEPPFGTQAHPPWPGSLMGWCPVDSPGGPGGAQTWEACLCVILGVKCVEETLALGPKKKGRQKLIVQRQIHWKKLDWKEGETDTNRGRKRRKGTKELRPKQSKSVSLQLPSSCSRWFLHPVLPRPQPGLVHYPVGCHSWEKPPFLFPAGKRGLHSIF